MQRGVGVQMERPLRGTCVHGTHWHRCRGLLCLTPWMTNEVLFQGPGVTSHTYARTHTRSCSTSNSACGVGWEYFRVLFRIIWRCFGAARTDEVLMTLYTKGNRTGPRSIKTNAGVRQLRSGFWTHFFHHLSLFIVFNYIKTYISHQSTSKRKFFYLSFLFINHRQRVPNGAGDPLSKN